MDTPMLNWDLVEEPVHRRMAAFIGVIVYYSRDSNDDDNVKK